jgi:predicted ATP-grasp superfamily ATP-dependent carboligase
MLAALPLPRAILLPCSDFWLEAVAGLPPETRRRFPASVPPPATVATLLDKGRFARALEQFGVPHPRTILLQGACDLGAVEERDLPGHFLKPCDSQRFGRIFGRKAYRVRDRAEAEERLGAMSEAGLEALLQEYVPGPPDRHVFLDGFRDRQGAIRALFARRRLRMFPVDFGNSTMLRSIAPDEVKPAARDLFRLLEGLGHRGIFSAEFKYDDRDGLFKLLEVNSRPWWFVEFATLCGVDVCRFAVLDALGLPVPDAGPYRVGRRFVHLGLDFRAFLHLRREGRLGAFSWLRSVAGAHGTIFRWSDPWPAVRLLARKLRGPR